ncbi:cytochrome-c oxidase, cbb3-type subunit III [Novosphingobium sp. PS1R-30]|uniref:Cbb3-type cytochrome c oxidase subunit n=1 Tax=Novosphingobium anseongense TaxID=3133436 RepID=A0ABU8RWI7_9SPHN
MANKRIDEPTGTSTVGHEWDGIEELDTPMPRWWLWSFYLCILFAIGYMVVYPAVPLLTKGTEGVFGWTSRGELAAETRAAQASRAQVLAQIAATPIEQLPGKPALMQAAVAGGRAAFRVNCVQCHGAGAAGVAGLYPNLADDDWLWGGNLKEIEQTIVHGIRQPGDDQTRVSLMPSFGRDGMLTPAQIDEVVRHVRTLSGLEKPSAASTRGAQTFADNCAACHGSAGKGDRQFGAPNLSDRIWLYGGSREAIAASIHNAHAGVMPAWGQRLDPVTIRMLAAYVHSLGGGEEIDASGPR